MKVTHTGVVIKLEEKDRKLISDTLDLFETIINELGGRKNKDKVVGWSYSFDDLCKAYDSLLEIFYYDYDVSDRDYDFKTKD